MLKVIKKNKIKNKEKDLKIKYPMNPSNIIRFKVLILSFF